MGMARLLSVVLVLAAVPVYAASVVSYELQLGGDNHAADVRAGSRPMYTSGSNADGQVVSKGILNWAASVAVTGQHSQSGHPSDGKATWGVANFVVSVELHQGTVAGPLVTAADFYSSIHDGGVVPCTTCKGGGGVCAGSAFALSSQENAHLERLCSRDRGGPLSDLCGAVHGSVHVADRFPPPAARFWAREPATLSGAEVVATAPSPPPVSAFRWGPLCPRGRALSASVSFR